ncbi:MAG: hypothetical protein JXR03_04865 [Cyclobacteriaceae bacterium]
MIKNLRLLLALLVAISAQWAHAQFTINEVRINNVNSDGVGSYIEIKGVPGSVTPSDTKLFAFGGKMDRAGRASTRMNSELANITIPDDGIYTVFFSSDGDDIDYPAATANNPGAFDAGLTNHSFSVFNNVTIALVRGNSMFFADDTDMDDDGIMENPFWTSVYDAVSIIKEDNVSIQSKIDNGDALNSIQVFDYSSEFGGGSVFGVNGSRIYSHAYRDPVTNAWIGKGNNNGFLSDIDSPGKENTIEVDVDRTISGAISAHNILVSSGTTLTVDPGATLTASGKIENDGSLIIEAGGSLVETSNEFSGNAITIKRTTQHAADALRHSMVGSPISGFNLETLGADSYYSYNEGNDTWSAETTNPVMTPGQGYSVVGKTDLVFSGTPNSGTIDVSATASSFKLLANPYPCAISIESFYTDNSAALDQEAIWIWNDGGSEGGQRSNSDYLVVNNLGAAQAGGTGAKASSSFADGYIGAMQGFFVLTSSAGTTVSFNNDMKGIGNNTDDSFFRKTSESVDIQKFTLRLKSENAFSETLFGFANDATLGVDKKYDAKKFVGNSDVQLAALINDDAYVITGNPLLTGEDLLVDLTFSIEEEGTYFLELDNITNMPEDYNAFVVDNENGERSLLTSGNAYSFSSAKVSESKRFSLLLSPADVLSNSNLSGKLGINVSGSNQELVIKAEIERASVAIYDILGRVIFFEENADFRNHQYVINQFDAMNTPYILKVNDEVLKFIIR